MHPAVNGFISREFYAGRLETDPSTARQRLVGRSRHDETGLVHIAIAHAGDAARSREEAEAVAEVIAALVGLDWTDASGVTRPLSIDDLIVVAPYNAHVAEVQRAIRIRLGRPGRVGTVDKFQGQEGAVAIFSMASSSPEEIPRGIEFLLDRNRFNVAISRARSLAILVSSPELLRVRPRTPEQMHLANALCAYVETAETRSPARW